MPAALLCVQFRNLLPSEELLMFARTLWHDLQLRSPGFTSGDATLCITQTSGEQANFQAELTIEGSTWCMFGEGADALTAVREAFRPLIFRSGSRTLRSVRPAGNFASARPHRSLNDTDLG